MNTKNIILASASPRRAELLEKMEIKFSLAPKYEVDEVFSNDIDKTAVAEYLSQLKAKSYPFEIGENDIIITADTVVLAQSDILGKPINRNDAIRMLNILSDCKHQVITGVTIRSSEKIYSFSVSSDVFFRKLTEDEIEYYIDKFAPFDKAGAYGIQEWIGMIGIERIEGSFYNVMGLPVCRLYSELKNYLDL